MMVYACKLSYIGTIGRIVVRLVWAKKQETLPEKLLKVKGALGVAQAIECLPSMRPWV
jgi:hypothetical protein